MYEDKSSILLPQAVDVVQKYAPNFTPRLGIVLGSGLSALANEIENSIAIPYEAIPGISKTTVKGHGSSLVLGYLNGYPVACLKGRLHLYEGTKTTSLRVLIRMLKMIGCEELILTNASGSLRQEAGPGSLVNITDHINFQSYNPLVGTNDESMGPRFVDMTETYDPNMRQRLKTAAEQLDIALHEGVYISVLGPSFETPAEIRAFRTLGADIVGMSTVPEVILARHCGLKVAAISAVTNYAAGITGEQISHEVTLSGAKKAERNFIKLISEYVGITARETHPA